MVIFLSAALVAMFLTLLVLWPQGLLISYAGATVAGAVAIVGAGTVLALRRAAPRPSKVEKSSDYPLAGDL
jgi:hypothetical protein